MTARIPRPDTGDPDSSLGHVRALDGVRGLAILAILLVHLFPANPDSPHPLLHALLVLRAQLWVGVQLFFALSGFLITGILYDSLGTRHYFRTFFARRCLRIFPLYYGFLGLLLLLTPWLHFDWQGQAWRLLTYTPNIPFRADWTQNPSPYINLIHFWSLAVEEQFYLLWPLLVFSLRRWRSIFLATLIGSALALAVRTAMAVTGRWPMNHALPACLDALLLGGALAMLVRSRHRERVLRWAAPVFLVTASFAIFQALTQKNYVWESNLYLTTVGLTIIALASTALIAASLHTGSVAQTLFEAPVMRFFGRYSYGLYVFHYSVYATAQTLWTPWLLTRHAAAPVLRLTVGLTAFTASILIAVLSYHLYEKRFLRMKRFFPYQREFPAKATPKTSG